MVRLLFFAAVLILSVSSCRQLLHLDLYQIVQHLFIDDGYYYFVIARNIAAGHGPTFDGFELTNGFHPLWAIVLSPLFLAMTDALDALRAIRVVEVFCMAVSVLLLGNSLIKSGFPRWCALLLPIPFFEEVAWQGGTEGALYLLLLSALCALGCGTSSPRQRGLILACGIALPWCRLEAIAFCIAYGSLLFWSALTQGERRFARQFLSASLGSLVALFALSWMTFDVAVPISGVVKQYQAAQYWKDAGSRDVLLNAAAILGDQRVYAALFWGGGVLLLMVMPYAWRRSPAGRRPHNRVLVFCISLLCAHGALVIYWTLFQAAPLVRWNWYYVPARLLTHLAPALILGGLWLVRSELSARGRRFATAGVIGAFALLLIPQFARSPVRPFDAQREPADITTWELPSYLAVPWIEQHLPENAVIGSPDSGALAYFLHRPVINLDGLVNSREFFEAIESQRVGEWIGRSPITHLANLIPAGSPEDCSPFSRRAHQRVPLSGSCRTVYESEPYGGGKMVFRVAAYVR